MRLMVETGWVVEGGGAAGRLRTLQLNFLIFLEEIEL